MSESIRVMRIIARMNVGGPALQVVGLTERLDSLGFDSRLLAGDVGPDEADYLALRASHVELDRIAGLGRRIRPTSDLRAFLEIRRRIREFRPDVVHTHTAKAGVLGRLATFGLRVPVLVHTYHGHLLHGYFGPVATRLVVLMERLLARRTTVLATVGSRVRDDLLAAGIGTPERYRVVPPGVPRPEGVDRSVARRDLGISEDGPVVAFVGRVTGIKRIDRFLEAAAAIVEAVPTARFLVVGGGDGLDAARAAAAPLGHRISFLGWRGDVGVVYSAADLIVLTSDNEGMPVSLIEAQISGVPAVATAVGSVGEVVLDGETGLLVPPEASAVADAVVSLLQDPTRIREMADRALQLGDRFSVDRLVSDTAEIYRSALGVTGRARGEH